MDDQLPPLPAGAVMDAPPLPKGAKMVGEKEAQTTGTSATTDVLNRALVAGTLGAPVDIASMLMKPFGYKEQEPVGGSEWIGRQMEKAGMVSPTRRPVAELATGLAPSVLTGGAALGRSAYQLGKRAIGTPARTAAEELKTGTAARYQAPIAEAERERARAGRAIEQIEKQPSVAAQRAARAPLTKEQQQATLQAQVRQPVREQLGARRVAAEQREAGALAGAESAERGLAQAQQAVNTLEQQLLSRPTITAEQFGAELRKTTKQLQQRLIQARTEGSNLGQVISSYGDTPVIDTSNLISKAKALSEKTRNPQVLGMLSEIQALAKTRDESVLTLQQADSLRKYLSKDIISKFFAQTGADKETLKNLREIRGALIDSTPQAYREALGRFSQLSRPLDIVERQGSLKRVVDIDPMSTAEKLTEAQVAGEIINKAKAGNPVFTRLLEISPELKESGRLYFTQDLFGKGAVPTEASLRTWLRANERPLKQLGLYDEFKSIKNAREAAQLAVDNAKLSTKVAGQAAKEASREAASARGLSKAAESRLQESLQLTTMPTQRPGETLAEALRRTRTGEKAAPIQTFITTRDKAQQTISSLTKMRDDISAAKTPAEVKTAVKKAADDLYDRGIIDSDGRATMLKDVENLQSLLDAQSQARKIYGYFAGAIGLSWLGRRGVESIVEGR